jgi:hypothetical protein
LGTDSIIPNADTSVMRVGNIMVVYNGAGKIVEVNPTTKTLVKSISYSFESHEGSVQRLPNGNWFVAKGMNSNVIAELDSNGTSIKTFTAPSSHMGGQGGIQRAYKYGMSYAGLKALGLVTTDVKEERNITCNKNTGRFSYNPLSHHGSYTIENSKGSRINIQIFSLNGEMVYSSETNTGTISFSTVDIIPGIYYIKASHSTGNYITKIVKM